MGSGGLSPYFFGGLWLVILGPYLWYGQRKMTIHWFSVSAGIISEHQPPSECDEDRHWQCSWSAWNR